MHKKIAFIVAIVLLLVGGAVYAFDSYSNMQIENIEVANFYPTPVDSGELGMFGASGDSNFTNIVTSGYIKTGNLTEGGGSLAVTATTTLTAAQICGNSVIEHDPQQATGINLTLPATSTLFADCFDAVGKTKSILLYNSADAGEVVTVVAGTGMDLQEPDGQNVVIGQNNYATLKFVRLSDTTGEMYVSVTETIPAD